MSPNDGCILQLTTLRYRRVTADNRAEYVRLALHYRLHEFDAAVAAARVVPVPLFSLFTGYELETMVCGSPDIPVRTIIPHTILKLVG